MEPGGNEATPSDSLGAGTVSAYIAHFCDGDVQAIVTPEELIAHHHGRYAEHAERPFYGSLVEFITRSPSFICVVEGPEDVWSIVRILMGPTNPAVAPPGTIRGDYGTDVGENLVHGSDSEASAQREVKLFFPDLG